MGALIPRQDALIPAQTAFIPDMGVAIPAMAAVIRGSNAPIPVMGAFIPMQDALIPAMSAPIPSLAVVIRFLLFALHAPLSVALGASCLARSFFAPDAWSRQRQRMHATIAAAMPTSESAGLGVDIAASTTGRGRIDALRSTCIHPH